MPRFLETMTDGADACAHQSAGPASLNALFSIHQKPFKRILSFLVLFINISSRSFWRAIPWRRGRLFKISHGETVMVADVFNNGVNSSSLHHFEARSKLVEKVSVMPTQSTKKRTSQEG